MTVRVTALDGRPWEVRRTVVRGRDLRGRRWRWRAPSWLGDLAELLRLGELGDVPILGTIVMLIVIPVFVVVVAVFVPFFALAVVEALVLGALALIGVFAATLAGRPILVRARPRAESGDVIDPPEQIWAVRGWRASREIRDRVVARLAAGQDLGAVPGRVRPTPSRVSG